MSATTSPRNLHICALVDSATELSSAAVDEAVFDDLMKYDDQLIRTAFQERLNASYKQLTRTKKRLQTEWAEGRGLGRIRSLTALDGVISDDLSRLHAAYAQYLDRLRAEQEPSEAAAAA